MEHSYRIVLADDHAMFRRGVKRIIQENQELEVVGEAADGLELLEIIKRSPPHMVIADVSMPNLRGLEATREIKMSFPAIKVIILTMHKDKEYLYHALAAGAEGYLLKEDADIELFSAIKTIRQGGTYISRLLAPQMTDIFMERQQLRERQGRLPGELLSTREREIIKLIAEGKSSREIADLLYISSRTVQHHRANIMRKLNFKKTADLVKYAIQKGYTSADGS
ncbi:MAG: response regulator transcription factor [Thermodesulfobacteriota bacterium]